MLTVNTNKGGNMKLHQLNRNSGDNTFCGPAVISYLTGINTSTAAACVRMIDPMLKRVKGLHVSTLIRTLKRLGFRADRVLTVNWDNPKPTLNQWLKESKDMRTQGRVFLVVAGNHYQLITGRRFACGITGEIVGLSDKRIMKRARVRYVYEIIPTADQRKKALETVGALDKFEKTSRDEYRNERSAQRKAKKIAKEYDIGIEVDRYPSGAVSIYFQPPDWMNEALSKGDLEFTTVAFDWFEAESIAYDLEEALRAGQKMGLDCYDEVA